MMKVYAASSWRNPYFDDIRQKMEEAGHEVYDFKCDSHFQWSEIDENWNNWTPGEYLPMLDHELAVTGFENDLQAMCWAEVCVLILPSGRSSHLEAGWFIGQDKPVIILLHEDGFEPELMYKMTHHVVTEYKQVLELLEWMDVPQCIGCGSAYKSNPVHDDGFCSKRCSDTDQWGTFTW